MEYEPPAQGVHDDWPCEVAKEPGGHAWHPLEAVPGAHETLQLVDPSSFEYVAKPAGQARQKVEPLFGA